LVREALHSESATELEQRKLLETLNTEPCAVKDASKKQHAYFSGDLHSILIDAVCLAPFRKSRKPFRTLPPETEETVVSLGRIPNSWRRRIAPK
jgi:hypothetical protein